jgi:hypothetical protein
MQAGPSYRFRTAATVGGNKTAPTRGAQVGDEVPDVAPAALRGMWTATQALLRQRRISAGHDVSDGGVAVALLEMAFAGNCGLEVELPEPPAGGAMAALFAEEPGLLLEVRRVGAPVRCLPVQRAALSAFDRARDMTPHAAGIDACVVEAACSGAQELCVAARRSMASAGAAPSPARVSASARPTLLRWQFKHV